jgi:hypothetical protein
MSNTHDDPQGCVELAELGEVQASDALTQPARVNGGCLLGQHSGGMTGDLDLGPKACRARRRGCRRD